MFKPTRIITTSNIIVKKFIRINAKPVKKLCNKLHNKTNETKSCKMDIRKLKDMYSSRLKIVGSIFAIGVLWILEHYVRHIHLLSPKTMKKVFD
jgi:hypothetical protein